MPGGANVRRRGIQAERDFVNWLRSQKLDAQRIPLSGAAGGRYTGDISVVGLPAPLEVKAIKGAAKTIKRWMQNAFGLVIKVERTPPEDWIVVLSARTFAALLAAYVQRKPGADERSDLGVASP